MRRVVRRVGNRGTVLGLLGVIWLVSGIGLADQPQRVGLVDERLPDVARAALWIVPGVCAVLGVWWRRLDEWAWALLIAPLAVGTAARVIAWATGTGPPGVWRGTMIFLALGLLVNRCAAGLDRPAPWDGRERRWTPQA